MSTQSKPIKIIFGTAAFGALPAELNQEFLDILIRNNVVDLDTASAYVRAYPFHQDSNGKEKIFY